jgi:hypothetical protein
MVGETIEGRTPGTASVHNGGNASVHPAHVRVHAIADKTTKNVRMQVNQAWRDEMPRHVNNLCRLLTRNRRCNARNLAILHGNIVHSMEAHRRVDHATTL